MKIFVSLMAVVLGALLVWFLVRSPVTQPGDPVSVPADPRPASQAATPATELNPEALEAVVRDASEEIGQLMQELDPEDQAIVREDLEALMQEVQQEMQRNAPSE